MGQLAGSGTLDQVSRQVGANESVTGDAIAAVLPTLITALARNASEPAGAESLHEALAADHDGAVVDDLAGFLGQGGDPADGEAILGHVLGGQRPKVEQGLSRGTGIDMSVIQQLLPLLAPVVLEYLGREQRQRRLQPGDLSDYLQQERRTMEEQAPAEANLGGLSSLLDMDRDGDVTDDAVRLGTGLLQSFLRGRGK